MIEHSIVFKALKRPDVQTKVESLLKKPVDAFKWAVTDKNTLIVSRKVEHVLADNLDLEAFVSWLPHEDKVAPGSFVLTNRTVGKTQECVAVVELWAPATKIEREVIQLLAPFARTARNQPVSTQTIPVPAVKDSDAWVSFRSSTGENSKSKD